MKNAVRPDRTRRPNASPAPRRSTSKRGRPFEVSSGAGTSSRRPVSHSMPVRYRPARRARSRPGPPDASSSIPNAFSCAPGAQSRVRSPGGRAFFGPHHRENRRKSRFFSFSSLDKNRNQAYCMASKDRIRRFLPQKPRTSLKKTN